MHPTDLYQQYQCPQEFQDRLTEIGGINKYDQPNFIVRWSQGGEEGCYYRAGGCWAPPGEPTYTGYRDLLSGGGTPSWCLLQWEDATVYGTPEIYYRENFDADTGLQTLGEYPYGGRYKVLYNLRWSERRGNKLHFEGMPLNSFLLETVVPIILAAKDISWEKTKAALQVMKDKEDKAEADRIEDVMRANALPFRGNAVSYGKQGCRTSLVDKKIEEMQRNWNKISQNAASLNGLQGKGLMQRPVI